MQQSPLKSASQRACQGSLNLLMAWKFMIPVNWYQNHKLFYPKRIWILSWMTLSGVFKTLLIWMRMLEKLAQTQTTSCCLIRIMKVIFLPPWVFSTTNPLSSHQISQKALRQCWTVESSFYWKMSPRHQGMRPLCGHLLAHVPGRRAKLLLRSHKVPRGRSPQSLWRSPLSWLESEPSQLGGILPGMSHSQAISSSFKKPSDQDPPRLLLKSSQNPNDRYFKCVRRQICTSHWFRMKAQIENLRWRRSGRETKKSGWFPDGELFVIGLRPSTVAKLVLWRKKSSS